MFRAPGVARVTSGRSRVIALKSIIIKYILVSRTITLIMEGMETNIIYMSN